MSDILEYVDELKEEAYQRGYEAGRKDPVREKKPVIVFKRSGEISENWDNRDSVKNSKWIKKEAFKFCFDYMVDFFDHTGKSVVELKGIITEIAELSQCPEMED